MRKSSSKVLKKPNKTDPKSGRARLLNGLARTKNAASARSRELKLGKTVRRNSNKNSSSWKNDPELNQILRNGENCRNKGDYEGAISAFQEAIRTSPRCSVAYWLLGGIYFACFDDPRAAIPYFQKAVQLSPKTEIASLALFHSLWNTDKLDEALEEMKRYQLLTNWSCKDYSEILKEINEKWVDPPNTKRKAKKVKS